MAETGFPLMLITTMCMIMYGEYCVYTAVERSTHTCTRTRTTKHLKAQTWGLNSEVWKLNLFGFFFFRIKNI